ncbi:MAG TPA: hypothetical protein VH395_07890, partial [Jatrophihabitantaceae bacterium]
MVARAINERGLVPVTAPAGPVLMRVDTTSAGRTPHRSSRRPHPTRDPRPTPAADHDLAADHEQTWQLVRRAQDGDGDAFGELYDRYVD